MEYFESTADPLKCYFEEKAAALFLRPEVLQVFLAADNRERDPTACTTHFLSDHVFRSSDDEADLPPLSGASPRARLHSLDRQESIGQTEEELLRRYNSSKMTKQIQCNYMMRVNDELQREPGSLHETLAARLLQFDLHEETIGASLEGQQEKVLERLAERKAKRFRGRENRFQSLSPKSPIGSISTMGSRMSRYNTHDKRKSIDLFGTVATDAGELTPNESGLFRVSGLSTPRHRRFDFQTVSLPDCDNLQ